MKALKISALVLALLIIGALAVLMFTAMKVPRQFLQEFSAETAKIGNNKVILAYPDELLEKKTILDARLAMSEDDSIGLRINVKEKSVFLEIKGIVLHKTPVHEMKTSSFFKHLSPAEKYVLFHRPLIIQRDESTISKDRFETVIAPKDSLEAKARAEVIPDTILHEPILYRLYLEDGIRLQIIGELHDSVPQFWPKFRFDYGDRLKYLKELTHSILSSKPVPYQPTISIVMDAKEAQAIYRAVPKKGNVILEF